MFVCRFSRGSAQTILPPNKNARSGRLCSSYEDQIKVYEREAYQMQEQAREIRGKKRSYQDRVRDLEDELQNAKVCFYYFFHFRKNIFIYLLFI